MLHHVALFFLSVQLLRCAPSSFCVLSSPLLCLHRVSNFSLISFFHHPKPVFTARADMIMKTERMEAAQIETKEWWIQRKVIMVKGKKKTGKKRMSKTGRKRPVRCGAAARCGSILTLTTILTAGYKTLSHSLINVTTHYQFINTSIIRLDITLPSGPVWTLFFHVRPCWCTWLTAQRLSGPNSTTGLRLNSIND